jgi:prepilin-type processing-associated H-X9-DG protein
MVFPVFARARESARKAVCLSNVKNIALAFQMYLADNNDTLTPSEHRQEIVDYFLTVPGGGGGGDDCSINPDRAEEYATRGNPYLRHSVILDEYVKNRDVWSCPSAKLVSGATFILPGPDWFGYLKASEGMWGGGQPWGPCSWPHPPGWGGDVTDSILQQRIGAPFAQLGGGTDAAHKAFVQSINTNDWHGTKLVEVQDPVNFIVCGDGGSLMEGASPGIAAYPDICCAECAGVNWDAWTWPTYDENWNVTCPNGDYCPDCPPLHARMDFMRDPNLRKAYTRHLGGVNLGFLDGHASWINSERLLAKYADGELDGIAEYCLSGSRALYIQNCGEPLPDMEFLY